MEIQHQIEQNFADLKSEILTQSDRWSKELKAAMEDLTTVKNRLDDTEKHLAALRRARIALDRETRMNFGDTAARITSVPEHRDYLNAVFRHLKYPTAKLPATLAKALTGVDSGLGQATVPDDLMSEIYSLLAEYGQWSSLGVIPVTARTNTIPVATSRPSYYWIGAGTGGTSESSAITEGSFGGTSVALSIQTLGALIHVTNELIEDSEADISAYVLRELAQAVAHGLDHACFAADGSADQTDAGYVGIFHAAAVNSNLAATAADGNTAVEKTDLEDWERCLATVNPTVLRRNARWWMHPQIISKAMLVRDASKRPIFQTALEAPSAGAIGSILGYPVTPVDAAPSDNTAAAKVAVFGDPQGMAVGIRKQLELRTTDVLKFAENMTSYRAIMRAGVKIKTTSGSTTLKPFAVLTLASA